MIFERIINMTFVICARALALVLAQWRAGPKTPPLPPLAPQARPTWTLCALCTCPSSWRR